MAQRAIEPLYLAATNGRGFQCKRGFVWDFVGSDDGSDEGDDAGEDSDDEDDEDESGSGSEDRKGKKKDSGSEDDDEDDEVARVRRRMIKADKRAAEAEKKLKEIEDKDKDEKTKATERVEELESAAKEKDATIGGLRLQVAFLSTNSHSWDDPEYALDFAERKGYLEDAVDDEGNIDSKELKKALDRLAKDKPSMVKKTKDDDDDDDEDDDLPSGRQVGNRRKRKRTQDDADLARRFPAAYV